MALTSDVKTLLSTVSNVYIGSMPATPDNSVCIYNTGGYSRSLSGTEVEEPTFQVKVRNTSYATGETLCNTIKDLLHGATSTKILMCEQQGDILDLGRDESNRQEWTINFRCYYRR
jgi:hypothetical protein